MCYSGECRWEHSNGDCNFPRIKSVIDKYKHPLCEIGDEGTETEKKWLVNSIKDVERLVEEDKKNNKLIF